MKAISIFLIYCLIALTTVAQSGTLDKNFGDTGVVFTALYGGLETVALQSNSRIIAAGEWTKNFDSDYGSVLVGYLPSGVLDSSFGNDGISFVNDHSDITSVAVLGNDKMITVNAYSLTHIIILSKYLANGNLDSIFGDNGQIQHSFSGVDAIAARVVKIQQDGKIVITGAAYFIDDDRAYEPKIITARFNADGSVDKSFGGKGYVLMEGEIANALVIQPDGKIVIGGNTGLQQKFILARYLPDGNLDEQFGNGGILTANYNNHEDYINALALQQDGKIVAAGVEAYETGNMITARFLPDGNLDKSFGVNGFTIVKFEDGSQARSVALQSDGKIILAGYSNPALHVFYFALVRLNATGVIDSSFGTNGVTETNIDGKSYGLACTLQVDGKIILGGINSDATNFVLARYNNDVQNKTPIARIKKWIEHHILHWQNLQASNNIAYYTIERSNNANGGFKQLAKVQSSSAHNVYAYTLPASESNESSTVNYYRINAVNNTGNIIASAVIEDAADAAISVYPNPVKNILHINGLNENVKYQIRITDEKGNVFAKASVNKASSYNFNVQSLHRGNYYAVIISLSHKPVTIQFVKE